MMIFMSQQDAPSPRAQLDQVLIGGFEKRPIVVVTYDQAWPERFRAERDRIGRALGQTARNVEHIGSTAVPGLAAKPVIDILLVVEDVDDEAAYGPALGRSGYVLRVREPGHRMFRTPQRDVHVHVYSAGSPEIRRYLLFRDWLRESDTDRLAYERVKRQLAAREWEDMNLYAEAKDGIVAEIMSHAERRTAGGAQAPVSTDDFGE
jgi:GrpB-like predicted nucleotidyltransferase (UPF0157 family)